MEGLSEIELMTLADALGGHKQLSTLGVHLGFRKSAVDNFLKSNRLNEDTSGTKSMIFEFRDKTLKKNLIPLLVEALERSDLQDFTTYVKKGESNEGIDKDQPSHSGQHHATKRKAEDEVCTEPPRKKQATRDGRGMESAIQTQEDWNADMKYSMNGPKKGYALIIGNSSFKDGASRPWAQKDVSNMQDLLKYLGYVQETHKDLSVDKKKPKGLKQTLQIFTKKLKSKNPQSALIYISSHGDKEGIQGVEGDFLSIEYLLELFSGVLPGKPKVFIIDACWGGSETREMSTSVPNKPPGPPQTFIVPENADVFIIHTTSYGKIAWSNDEEGSWFVQDLCKVVKEFSREDLDTIMMRVTKLMRKRKAFHNGREMGTQSATIIKQGVDRKLFFFPENNTFQDTWHRRK